MFGEGGRLVTRMHYRQTAELVRIVMDDASSLAFQQIEWWEKLGEPRLVQCAIEL